MRYLGYQGHEMHEISQIHSLKYMKPKFKASTTYLDFPWLDFSIDLSDTSGIDLDMEFDKLSSSSSVVCPDRNALSSELPCSFFFNSLLFLCPSWTCNLAESRDEGLDPDLDYQNRHIHSTVFMNQPHYCFLTNEEFSMQILGVNKMV